VTARKRSALLILLLALGCLATSVPGAGAKPRPSSGRLLPKRGCKGLLDVGDFPGAISKGGTDSEQGTFYASLCSFLPPEPPGAEPIPAGFGFDVLDVFTRKGYEPKGRPRNLLAHGLSSVPAGTQSVIPVRGIGTRAAVIITEEGNPAGLVQVRNDLFAVYPENLGSVKGLLSKVARELSPTGK
jgi:hypothetical protein